VAGVVDTGTQVWAGAKTFNGVMTLANATDATSTAGALVVEGGICCKKKLYVTTGLTSEGATVFNDAGSATADFRIEGDTDANLFFVDASADKIGIGTASPGYKLHSVGTVYLDNRTGAGYGTSAEATLGIFGLSTDTAVDGGAVYNMEWKVYGNASGQYWYSNYITRGGSRTLGAYCTGTAWTNSSDIKNKHNIVDIKYGLSTVLALRPVSFDWKTVKQKDIGFIAQEMEQVIPEVVTGEEGSKGISYGNLVAVCVQAIKEQQAIISTQAGLISSLEARVASQEARLATLEGGATTTELEGK
jgi:hypothetical protein